MSLNEENPAGGRGFGQAIQVSSDNDNTVALMAEGKASLTAIVRDWAARKDDAQAFLTGLDEGAERFCFRTFPDDPKADDPGRNYEGTLDAVWPRLLRDSIEGRGVFVVINKGGQRGEEISRVRAVFADFDGPPLPETFELEPHLIVQSSPGKWHVYWLVDGLPPTQFKRVQQAIASRYGTDGSVCDLPRVMRLPGVVHQKELPYRVRVTHISGALPYSAEKIVETFSEMKRPAIATGRHEDLLRVSWELARDVRRGTLSRDEALGRLDSERSRGRWSRDMPDGELSRALDGAIEKLQMGEGEPHAVLRRPWKAHDDDRFSLAELMEPPPLPTYVLEPYLPEGKACILTAPGGTNKTTLAVAIGISICAGREFLGTTPRPGRVLYVTAEDRRDDIRGNVFAATRDLSAKQLEAVREGFFVRDVVGKGFMLTRRQNGGVDTAPEVEDLIAYAREVEPVLIIFDTLSRLHGGDEDNTDLARFVSAMEAVSVGTGATTLVLHHTGKAQARADMDDQYSSRGGSALSDNSRSVMNLVRVSPDTKDAPTNATELIKQARLLRLSHVKTMRAAAPVRYLECVPTPHAARLREFKPEFGKGNECAATWTRIARWLETQGEVAYPNRASIEAAGIAGRNDIRRALQWAVDRELVVERPHPNPQGARKSYLALPLAGPNMSAREC